jgi:hypothetical protein
MDLSTIIDEICRMVELDVDSAKRLIREEYPFESITRSKRAYSPLDSTRIFMRDAFVDRYSGQRLVFPGTLRTLAILLPRDFPFHPNWKMEVTHPAFWQLLPTIDHILPVARGGVDEPSNWVTTSQLKNSAKANWTLEELGWQLVPAGQLEQWDGLTKWFVDFVDHHNELLRHPYIKAWFRAAVACLKDHAAAVDA